MNGESFDDLLTIWNKNVSRGAARRLSEKLHVGPPTVTRWRKGSPVDPALRERVAAELGVGVDRLNAALEHSRLKGSIGRESAMFEQVSGQSFRIIPHLGSVSASRFNFSFDQPPDHFSTMGVRGGPRDRYAILKITGDCMAPKIMDGDEILIRQTDIVTDGTIAVVCFDGECTLKRVYRKKDGVLLKADNPIYKPQTIASSKIRVMAEVIKILSDPGRKP